MEDIYHFPVGDKSIEVFMSYGLLDELARLVGDIEVVPQVMVLDELREPFLVALLSERDENGKITEKFNFFKSRVRPEDVTKLYEWAAGHLMDFFLQQLETAGRLGQNVKPRLEALMSSANGSQASVPVMPSVGPSEPSPVE